MFYNDVTHMLRMFDVEASETRATRKSFAGWVSDQYDVGRFRLTVRSREATREVLELSYRDTTDLHSDVTPIANLASLKRFLDEECPAKVSMRYKREYPSYNVSAEIRIARGSYEVTIRGYCGGKSSDRVSVSWHSFYQVWKEKSWVGVPAELASTLYDDVRGCFRKISDDFFPEEQIAFDRSPGWDGIALENVLPMLDAILESDVPDTLKAKVMKVVPGSYCSEEV